MSFLNLPWAAVLAGWAAIAGGLYLLQRLRVRHRELEVPTTLFWREAVEETRARVLVRRFRHPWAYALLLLIGSLLWFAAAGLRADGGDGRRTLLVVDGSAGMGWGARFAETRALLFADAAALPPDAREVVWVGAATRTLLRPGEEARLLEERLLARGPEAAPARVEELLVARFAGLADGADGADGGGARTGGAHGAVEVRVYGDAPLREEALALLPDGVEVLRRAPEPQPRAANGGFLALGVSEAASGSWDRVDLLVETVGTDARPTLRIDGAEASALPQLLTEDGGRRGLLYRDLPARGQLLELTLPSDAFPGDDRAQVVLPSRPPLRVALAPELADRFLPLVAADPALVLADGESDVVVRPAGSGFGGARPALELADPAQSDHAFAVRHDRYGDPQQLLREAYARLGLGEIDALALAQELQRPVGLGVETGGPPTVTVWGLLLDPAAGFTGTRSFPLFFARALRWLGGAAPLVPTATAGAPLAALDGAPLAGLSGAWRDASGAAHDAAGATLTLGAAGLYQDAAGARLAVSLLDPATTLRDLPRGLAADAGAAPSSAAPLATWLGLLALLLLLAEWFLYQRGRMP